jgi:crotonobetainyl-CoA:carnitine CoA-transferase CaiB-like acyl-CoA transferase
VQTTREVLASEQLAARDYWQALEHPELGQAIRYPGPFAKFSASPLRYRRRPPTVGEHNRELYVGELGFTEQQLAEMQRTGVI